MIKAQNLVKKFGDFTAVKDISFTVEAGEIFAFLGPNGAGKTTTIKMLTTLLTPTSGKIELDGLDPTSRKMKPGENSESSSRIPVWTVSRLPTRIWNSTPCFTKFRARCGPSVSSNY